MSITLDTRVGQSIPTLTHNFINNECYGVIIKSSYRFFYVRNISKFDLPILDINTRLRQPLSIFRDIFRIMILRQKHRAMLLGFPQTLSMYKNDKKKDMRWNQFSHSNYIRVHWFEGQTKKTSLPSHERHTGFVKSGYLYGLTRQ